MGTCARLRHTFPSNPCCLVKDRAMSGWDFKVGVLRAEPWKLSWKLRDTVTRCCTRTFVPQEIKSLVNGRNAFVRRNARTVTRPFFAPSIYPQLARGTDRPADRRKAQTFLALRTTATSPDNKRQISKLTL